MHEGSVTIFVWQNTKYFFNCLCQSTCVSGATSWFSNHRYVTTALVRGFLWN